MNEKHKVAVIGAGAWGTTIAHLLGINGHTVFLWSFDQQVADTIAQKRVNEWYIPEMFISDNVNVMTNLFDALKDAAVIVYASPSRFLLDIFSRIPVEFIRGKIWVLTSKGVEEMYGRSTFEMVCQTMAVSHKNIAVLSGPTFAVELCKKVKTRAVVASCNRELAYFIVELFSNDFFHLTVTSDVVGVEWCGVLKNIGALFLGMLDGIDCGKNTQAFLFVQLLKEMRIWVELCEGFPETVYGDAGLGDLYLTATFGISKNRMYGFYIGKNMSDEFLKEKLPTVPEGVSSLSAVYDRIAAKDKENDFPLLCGIYAIVKKRISVSEYIEQYW